jgi:hypothetical protein
MGKHVTKRTANVVRPKSKLGLPDLDHSKAAVLESLRSPESKRGYRHAIDEFISWYCSEPRLSFNKVVVTRFRIALEPQAMSIPYFDHSCEQRWPFEDPNLTKRIRLKSFC